ncbi:MAG TPA: hypothetical protein GXZ48_03490 [Acholeplasmataceae bacterium]|jgi:hypothetical protein|nr:hypothetical protein [Acholeplasmataceae bacterium]
MDDGIVDFDVIDNAKLPKHKYSAKEMGRYYNLLAKSFNEMTQDELEFIKDMEKETIRYWQEYKNWSYDKAHKYVLDNRNRIIREHKLS